MYAHWVELAGGHVRGSTRVGAGSVSPAPPVPPVHLDALGLGALGVGEAGGRDTGGRVAGGEETGGGDGGGGGAGWGDGGGGGGWGGGGAEQEGLWPLQLVNPNDAEQMGVLFNLLGQVVQYSRIVVSLVVGQ